MRCPSKMPLPALVGMALSLSAPLTASADGTSVASSLEVYVLPAANQTTEQQAQAEQQAAGQAGKDATRGAGVKGAAAGAVSGRRQARKAQAQAQSQAQAQPQATAQAEQREAATAEQLSGSKKAFGACLEGKKYTVKFRESLLLQRCGETEA